MNTSTRILITGAGGLVGHNTVEELRACGYTNLLTPSSGDLNLCDEKATDAFFTTQKPEVVLHVAGRVGGIQANIDNPVAFLQENLEMGLSVLKAAQKHGVKKLINMGSSCIYPRECPQPMKEEYMLTGPLEPTNEGYGLAKIAILKLCAAMHAEDGLNMYTVIPPNLYGRHERLDSEHSHVIAGLMLKCTQAHKNGDPTVTLWGTGSARREFLNAKDVAKGLVFFLEKIDAPAIPENFINIGSGKDISIRELADIIRDIVGYEGTIIWDSTRPDGMPQKLLDSTRAETLGWKPTIDLQEGLKDFYAYTQQEKN